MKNPKFRDSPVLVEVVGGHMADIFVAFDGKSEWLSAKLITQLENVGYTVAWDQGLSQQDVLTATVKEEIDAAKAVLMLWTPLAMESSSMRALANLASEANKLVHAKLEPCILPMAFPEAPTVGLTEWRGDSNNHTWRRLLDRLQVFVDRETTPLPDSAAIEPQSIHGIRFGGDANGPIHLADIANIGEHLLSRAGRADEYLELRVKCGSLQALGSNRLGDLGPMIDRFMELGGDVHQVRAKLFWSRMNSLRITLQGHQAAVVEEEDHDDRRLEPVVAGLLTDLVETINVFVLGDPGLMELDAKRPGPQETRAAAEEAWRVAPAIEDVANSAIATRPAREILQEQFEATVRGGESLFERQAAEFGRVSLRNFFGEALRRAYDAARNFVRGETATAIKGMREGFYRAAGAALLAGAVSDTAGFTSYHQAIIGFFVKHAGALIDYVSQAFQNPALVNIIKWIAQTFS